MHGSHPDGSQTGVSWRWRQKRESWGAGDDSHRWSAERTTTDQLPNPNPNSFAKEATHTIKDTIEKDASREAAVSVPLLQGLDSSGVSTARFGKRTNLACRTNHSFLVFLCNE